jgi:hypothetical protein
MMLHAEVLTVPGLNRPKNEVMALCPHRGEEAVVWKAAGRHQLVWDERATARTAGG